MRCYKKTLSVLLLLFFLPSINFSQSIKINEISPSNTSLLDEDGESSDWIELFNSSDQIINLENWSITDDITEPQKWIFPTIEISPKDYLLLFASGKDRNKTLNYHTVMQEGDACKYIIPSFSTNSNWRTKDFNDSNWSNGTTGIGYGDGDDNTNVTNGTRSVFLRQQFTITEPAEIAELILQVDYDDGFVAYINGKEIARANIDADEFPAYNAGVVTDREAQIYAGGIPEKFVLTDMEDILVAGENVLAMQVHNISSSSSDLSIIPFLTLGATTSFPYQNIPDILGATISILHTNFKLGSEEGLYIFDANGNFQDSIYATTIPDDISLGRYPDGSNNSVFFEATSPDATNNATFFEGFINDTLLFSKESGIYSQFFNLSLSATEPDAVIRFTTNGTQPTSNSSIYQNPLQIRVNTTVKAAVFKENFLPSKINTKTYLVEIAHDLPILSIAFNPTNFFSNSTGMYSYGTDYEADFPHFGANFWKDLEKPVHLSFFEENELKFSLDAGAKIFGGWSRGFDQRSLSFFFRKKYGKGSLKYPLFSQRPYDKFEGFIARNSGNDWPQTMLRDLTLTGLMENSNVDIQTGRPVVAYLNGDYWGIYNIREKINEHYLASLHDIPTEDISLLEKNSNVIFGNNQEYNTLIDFVRNNDLNNSNSYEKIAEEIDLANYIQYQVAQIYFDNTDWPGNNIKFWKHKNGKWRWILFDTDFGFGIWNGQNYRNNTLRFALQSNGAAWPNPPWSTLLFRRLMTNETFKKRFINTFADELNTRFQANNVKAAIDANADRIRSEIGAHFAKWKTSNTDTWNGKLNQMRTFANQRVQFMRNHIRDYFGLPTYRTVNIEIDNPNAGSIQLNTLRIEEASWRGSYYPTVPISLTAIAKPDYHFSHWSGTVDSDEKQISLDPNLGIRLTAHFVKKTMQSDIIFNEINYKSSEETDVGDWVEFYNKGGEQDLTDWAFKDDNNEHIFTFPIGTILGANEYLVLARDTDRFQARFPNILNQIGDFDFGLSNKGELIRLFDSEGILIDSVHYLPDNGWPEAANGGGPSLELIAPETNNDLAENWISYTSNGTPGRQNGDYTYVFEKEQLDALVKISPNPFKDKILVEIDLPQPTDIQIDLLNINGQLIQHLNTQLSIKKEQLELDIPVISSGNYLIRLRLNNQFLIKKVIKK